jgi:hyperosmotically inducible protein
MFRVVQAVATGLVCMAIFIGCQAIKDLESNPKFEDTKIIATVKAQLALEDTSTVQGIDVRVDDGVATLKGTVDSEAKKNKAGDIAGKVGGVKSVVNNIEVKP